MNEKIKAYKVTLNNQNEGYDVKIRMRKNRHDTYRLYLDYWHRSKRRTENLELYVTGKPEDKVKDETCMKLARQIRSDKEKLIMEGKTGIAFATKQTSIDFLEYFEQYAMSKKDRNYGISYRHFCDFYGGNKLEIAKIDLALCEDYRQYLLNLDVTEYTAKHYLVTFKATLNQAVKQGYLPSNPAMSLTIKYDQKSIEYLTIDELRQLANTPCKYRDLKNGFLFSCYTGLRKSDLLRLTYSDLKRKGIKLVQKKTKTEVSFKLHPTALAILKEQKKYKVDDHVFHIPTGGKTSRRLKAWVKAAGIDKEITFHCSRHTFGCRLIEQGVDVFTVKKLMGHKEISTTMQYVEKVDSTKDKAIDMLPSL